MSNSSHIFTSLLVQILSCRTEVQRELVRQVGIFLVKTKRSGMKGVCDFLRPFVNYSIIRMPVSVSFRSFVRAFVSLMASLSCSLPHEAIPVIKLLMQCLKYFPLHDSEVSGLVEGLRLFGILGFSNLK